MTQRTQTKTMLDLHDMWRSMAVNSANPELNIYKPAEAANHGAAVRAMLE